MSETARNSAYFTRSFLEQVSAAIASERLSRGKYLAAALLGAVGSTALALFAGFLIFVQSLDNSETEPPAKADAIVALTGGSDRIADAVQLLAEGRAARLLISGVNKGIAPDRIARRLPDHADLFACCIELDYGAGNTVGNATETRRWARRHKTGSIILVTANYHMPRALIEFRRAMPDVSFIARPVVPYGFEPSAWWRDGQTAQLLAGEYAKFLAAWGRSVIEPAIGDDLEATGSIRRMGAG
jgi:uncharacterized SAM-binding protein YcdF (DUF218 family)